MKFVNILISATVMILGFGIARYFRYTKTLSRPVEMESIPAGYSYEGRFGQGKDRVLISSADCLALRTR